MCYSLFCHSHLNGVTGWVETEAESLIEGGLSVMAAHSRLFLYDPLLCGHVNHIELHIQIFTRKKTQK